VVLLSSEVSDSVGNSRHKNLVSGVKNMSATTRMSGPNWRHFDMLPTCRRHVTNMSPTCHRHVADMSPTYPTKVNATPYLPRMTYHGPIPILVLGNLSAPALGDQFFRLDDRMGCVGGTLPITIDEDYEIFVRRDLLFRA
jgi:hypothetical protein